MIAVFAYAFPHRKTHDFLCELMLSGHKDVIVIAAPFKVIAEVDKACYLRNASKNAAPISAKNICSEFNYQYFETAHDNIDLISKLVVDQNIKLGIISGARIIKQKIIDLFEEGIVNFHPGKIPETSGLDAFFYSIKNNVEVGVTTHLIDPRVDAGKFLAFDVVNIKHDDTPEDVQFNNYAMQITALRKFLNTSKNNYLNPLEISNYKKNIPMKPKEKLKQLDKFLRWKKEQIFNQYGHELLKKCTNGELKAAMNITSQAPGILEFKNEKGWTPLIVAAFNQHKDLVEAFLRAGANPNVANINGTTPLMFAKTALMKEKQPSTELLELLIAYGANINYCDKFGKNIHDYVSKVKVSC